MSAKHTSGPWTYKRGAGRYAASHYIEAHVYSTPTVISGKDQISQLHGNFGADPEVEANARLISAAPELLAALQSLLHEEGGSVGFAAGNAKCIAARAAISKALGEPQCAGDNYVHAQLFGEAAAAQQET
jgi:hypothetical protein